MASAERIPAMRRAVAMEWAKGFVVTPSTTSTPLMVRLPAQRERW